MKTPWLMVFATAACTTTAHQSTPSPAAQPRADRGPAPYTAADVHFVAGVIGHHPPAVQMAGGGPPHGASPAGRAPGGRNGGPQKRENPVPPALFARAKGVRAPSRPTRSRDARHGSPDAQAGDAAPRPDGPVGRRARRGVRPPVPHVHDSAPPGRAY